MKVEFADVPGADQSASPRQVDAQGVIHTAFGMYRERIRAVTGVRPAVLACNTLLFMLIVFKNMDK